MKNKKLKKVLVIVGVILIFVIGIIVGRVWNQISMNYAKNESTTTTQIVEKQVGTQTIENTLTSSGEVSSSGTEKLELSTSKYFNTMCVEEDDIVLKGEKILEYTNGTYLKAEYDCLISSYSVPKTGSKCTSSNYVQVQNLENMQVQLKISESDINKVEVGQEVEIEVSAIEDSTYTGTIKSVSGVGSYSSSGTNFNAVVEFENDGNVKVGMSASSTIVIEKAENCTAIEIEAVQTSGNEKYVVVVKEDGTTENVTIETGISNDTYVQVTSGLEGRETIQMIETVTTNNSSRRNSSGKGQSNSKGSTKGGMQEGGQMQFEKPSGDMQMPQQ